MSSRSVAALDLGGSKVACVVARPSADGTGFDVLGAGVASHQHADAAWPGDPAVLAEAIERALEQAAAGAMPDLALVSLTHPGLLHTRVTVQIDLADEPIMVRSRDLKRIGAQAISQALPLDRDTLLLEPLGYSGNGFESVRDPRGLAATRLIGIFQLISMPLSVRRAVVQALELVGLEPDRIVYNLQAVAAVSDPMPARTLLVDIGGCSTDVAVCEHGCLSKTASVPWGGMMLVEQIARVCRITMDQALTISLEGLGSPKAEVRRIVAAQLGALKQALEEILRDEPAPELVVVTGRGALIDGVVEWIKTATQVTAVVGRSPRTKHVGDLGRQLALTPAFGLLEMAYHNSSEPLTGPRRLVESFIGRTRQVLVEYF